MKLTLIWSNYFAHSILFFEIEKIVLNDLKVVRKNDVKMAWFYEFRDDINSWNLKILYRDLESWKK